jgi:hypothetical protein
MLLTLTGALLAAFSANASAGDKDHGERHAVSRYDQHAGGRDHAARGRHDTRRDTHVIVRRDDHHEHVSVARGRYFGARDVVVVRNYYRPYYRPAAAHRVYLRNAYLPFGWERRIVAVPVYVERQLAPLPYGYTRGVIDGQLVVHNNRGLIVDVAVLF